MRKTIQIIFLIVQTLSGLLLGPALSSENKIAQLAEKVRSNPKDLAATYEFVESAVANRDYEAAIGALERLLMFNGRLTRVHEELGTLYAQLGAYEMSAYHLRAARNLGTLPASESARIGMQLPEVEKRAQQVRFSGQFISGLRSQSNANFFPSNGLFQIGGIGYRSFLGQRPDMNAFQLAQAEHDFDFDTEIQATAETHVSAYATQQYNLTLYNVTLFSGSTGIRFELPNIGVSGVSIKPYVLGTSSSLGGQNYLNAGGGGITFRIPVNASITIDPGAEFRSLYVNRNNAANGGRVFSTISTLATGDALTGYLSGRYQFSDNIKFETRAAFTRANANISVQSSNQIDVQALIRTEFADPITESGTRWAISPYVRFTHLAFDAANILVNPWIARTDTSWIGGGILDAPITPYFGFLGTVEFAQNFSNITNFQAQNLSVSLGPSLKF